MNTRVKCENENHFAVQKQQHHPAIEITTYTRVLTCTSFTFYIHDYRSVVLQSNAFLIWTHKLSGMKRDMKRAYNCVFTKH